MWKTEEGSTSRLVQLCAGYFVSYIFTGVSVKFFLGKAEAGFPGMNDMQYLVYSTLGGSLICLAVVIARRWFRLAGGTPMTIQGVTVPREILYIIPSGVCTAVVIPTTTLMYSLPISVMVAMVIMRGSVIVISRVVDAVQIRQGILKRKVYASENWAVLLAIAALSVPIAYESGDKGGFDFLSSNAAVGILSSYITAYTLRIYIMNYYKNTRQKGVRQDNQGFFGLEQIAASIAMLSMTGLVYVSPEAFGWNAPQISQFQASISVPHPAWPQAVFAGSAFGVAAFFSVFIFMFAGRTATFAGLVNRLTSLIAGTSSTLLFALFFGGKLPKPQDWISLALILIAVRFLTVAEKQRAKELQESSLAVPATGASPALAGAPDGLGRH